MKKFTKNLLLMLALVFALAACSNPGSSQTEEGKTEVQTKVEKENLSSEETTESSEKDNESESSNIGALTFTDGAGKEISLEKNPEKIVVTQPSDAEILFEIGAGDKIIGRGDYVDYPEEVDSIKTVGSGENLNIEEVIALEPEVLIMGMMSQTEDQVKKLEDAGITVVSTDANSLEEIYKNIELLGQLTDKEDEAKALVEDMKSVFDEYKEKASENGETHSVYYEISPLEFDLWTGGKNTFFDELGEIVGLENIFNDVDGWSVVSEEEVINRNPEFIITSSYPSGDIAPEDEIMSRENWKGIDAVANSKVFSVDNDEFTRPGPRLRNAVKVLFENVYGE